MASGQEATPRDAHTAASGSGSGLTREPSSQISSLRNLKGSAAVLC